MPSDISILTLGNARYPSLIKQLTNPPRQLYIRGNVDTLQEKYLLAVVGSRSANEYGRRVCEKILPPLVQTGIVLVSGLAHGIDSYAHKVCVDFKRPTIAVLGSGVDDDSIYPKSNLKLVEKILTTGGCLISEHPVGQKSLRHFFPQRNRIIAGLTKATLLIQAKEKSGSLITARLALEANREVLAIPGPITDPLSWGTNMLIKDGATPITSAEDVLNLYGLEKNEASPTVNPQLSLEHSLILKHLSADPMHIDTLIQTIAVPSEKIIAQLLELELLGIVQQLGGMRYIRK